jgi:hypothetical protein
LNPAQEKEVADVVGWGEKGVVLVRIVNRLMREAYAAGKTCCCPGCEAWDKERKQNHMTSGQRRLLTKLAKRLGRLRIAEHILPNDNEKQNLREQVIPAARMAEDELCNFVDGLLDGEGTKP